MEGRYTAKVHANSVDEAREKAVSAFENADFGKLADIGDCDTKQIYAEDAEGNFLWEAD